MLVPLAVAASAAQPIQIRPFVTADGRTITLELASEDGSSFAVDSAATTLSLRSLDRHGAVIHVSGAARGVVVASALPAGSPVVRFTPETPVAALTFSLPSSAAAGMYSLKIAYTGESRLAIEEAIPSQVYVSTARDQPDSGLLKARDYVGKVVFLMSATEWVDPLGCLRSTETPSLRPASTTDAFVNLAGLRGSAWHVVSVRRLTGSEDGYFSSIDPDFLAIEPLEVVLTPLSDQPSFLGGPDSAGARRYLTSCEKFVSEFADPWELQRRLFKRSPFDHPEWPKRFQAAVQDGDVLPGMSHEMVANVFGYPSVYAPIPELDRMNRWDYDEPAPWGPTITFRGDRVVNYDPGSAPP